MNVLRGANKEIKAWVLSVTNTKPCLRVDEEKKENQGVVAHNHLRTKIPSHFLLEIGIAFTTWLHKQDIERVA